MILFGQMPGEKLLCSFDYSIFEQVPSYKPKGFIFYDINFSKNLGEDFDFELVKKERRDFFF